MLLSGLLSRPFVSGIIYLLSLTNSYVLEGIIFPSSKISASINTVQTHLSSVVQARISQSIEAFRSITGTKMIGSETYVATYLQGLYTKEIDAVVSFRYLQKLSTVLGKLC